MLNKFTKHSVRTVIAIILIVILVFIFETFIKIDYGYGISSDGMWEAYVIPDRKNFAIGVLIYKGNWERNAGEIEIEYKIGDREGKCKIEPQDLVFDIDNYVKLYLIGNRHRKFYDFLEFSDWLEPEVKINVHWTKEGEKKESCVEVNYKK